MPEIPPPASRNRLEEILAPFKSETLDRRILVMLQVLASVRLPIATIRDVSDMIKVLSPLNVEGVRKVKVPETRLRRLP